MKHITAEVQNLNTISLRAHLRSSDTVSRHQKNGFVETRGSQRRGSEGNRKRSPCACRCREPRLFGSKSNETITQDAAGSVCPARLAANGFGRRTAETPDCWSKPFARPPTYWQSPVCGDLWAGLKAMLLSECFCYFAYKVVTAIPHWPWGHYVTLQKIILPHLYFRLTSTCFQVSLNFSII